VRDRGRYALTPALDGGLQLPRDRRGSIDARLRSAGENAAVTLHREFARTYDSR